MDKPGFLFNHFGEIREDVGGAYGAFVVFDFSGLTGAILIFLKMMSQIYRYI